MSILFHPSLEGAQHGGKTLGEFLGMAKLWGCQGAQPSNYHLTAVDGKLMSAHAVKQAFDDVELHLDGVSAHCITWVHGTAWTGSKTIRPFIPAEVAQQSSEMIEVWAQAQTLLLLELCAELGVKVVPMFWGVLFGWEVSTGYPWGFWQGGDYDLIKEGVERFVKKTEKIRNHARTLGISLAHEIHRGTAAMTARDFLTLVDVCDGDPVLTVNADPTHCWEGESWEQRFLAVGKRVAGCHVKDHTIREGFPLSCMEPRWTHRPMQFTRLGEGQVDLVRYSQLMLEIGYQGRYCKANGTKTAPLVVEAESAFYEIDDVSKAGVHYVRDRLCSSMTTTSFEKGMGQQ